MNEYQSSDGYVKARGFTANEKPLYIADVFDIIEATTKYGINIPSNCFEKKKFCSLGSTQNFSVATN